MGRLYSFEGTHARAPGDGSGTRVVASRLNFARHDWSGDGAWDHVAVVVGTNSAGQKIVDAHTTDYYHAFWKMGYSATRYKYARVRAQWVV